MSTTIRQQLTNRKPDSHHEWRVGEPPPPIRPHSLAKHRVLERYLVRYVDVLTSNLKIPEFRFTLVDGFAGGGLYRDIQTQELRFGSPLLMLKAMRESVAVAQARRLKEFRMDVDYLFVEESRETFPFLKETIEQSEYRHLLPDKIKLINGTFIDQVDVIVSHVRSRRRGSRAIFLLDQFGYSDVPFPAIRSILSNLSNAEVILTFATDCLIDYLGEQNAMQKTLERLGLKLSRDQFLSAKNQTNWRCAIQVLLHHLCRCISVSY